MKNIQKHDTLSATYVTSSFPSFYVQMLLTIFIAQKMSTRNYLQEKILKYTILKVK